MLDAVTFLVAGASVLALSVVEAPHPTERLHWVAEVAAGARHIRRTPLLLHPTIALGICLLVLGFSESAVYAVVDAFGKPVTFVGPVVTVQGVGAVVSGLLSSRVIRAIGEARAIIVGLGVLAVGLAGVIVSVAIWQLLVSTVVLGAGIPVLLVAYTTLLQKQTPGHLMGRVGTTTEVLTTTPQAISIATGALLVTLVDYRLIFGAMAVGTVVAAAYLAGALRGRMDVSPRVPGATDEPAPVPGPVLADGLAEPTITRPVGPETS